LDLVFVSWSSAEQFIHMIYLLQINNILFFSQIVKGKKEGAF
jgi:hypothetical protein